MILTEKVQCNLCGMELPTDDYLIVRMNRHEEWHRHCGVQKRNTVEGEVEWIRI